MDRYLKERLVGAAVLVATAIILIPEMLSGPRSTSEQPIGVSLTEPSAEPSADVSKLKTYSIDLSKPSATTAQTLPAREPTGVANAPIPDASRNPSVEKTVSTPAPPPEDLQPDKSQPDKSQPDKSQPDKTASKQEPVRNAVAAPIVKAEAPPAKTSSPASSQALNEPSRSDSNIAVGWSVQVGSFGVRATSERIASDLKRDGYSAFVVAFRSDKQTMYRVRVGPERDRASAETLLRKLKPQYSNATLVPPA